MSNNFFNDDDDGSEFRDIPDEVGGGQTEIPQIKVSRPAPAPIQEKMIMQEYEEDPELDTSQESDEEDFSTVLSDARQRMEMGRLYEMIMDHDIFAGADADEKAIKRVTQQIRNFAKEQMEIMLGMRQEAPKGGLAAADFPFNDLEVAALKDLAYMATKGASAREEAQQFTPQAVPVAPRRTGLNPIGVKHSAPKPAQRQAAPAKPLAQKPQTPVKRDPKQERTEAMIAQILQEENISRAEYDRQYPPDYKPLSKPLNNMNEHEIKEWRRQEALKTHKQVKNPAAIPMPTAEQEEMLHTQRAQTAAANPQMQVLMAALTKKK